MSIPLYRLVNTETQLSEAIAYIVYTSTICKLEPLFVSIAGSKLCRNGSISLVQVFIPRLNVLFIIDISVLGERAFSVEGSGQTFKQILESPEIEKVFFDVRNSSGALHSLYGIRLSGVHDLQLLELATCHDKSRVHSLYKCVQESAELSKEKRRRWMNSRNMVSRLYTPKNGAGFQILEERPLAEDIKVYCAQNVLVLPDLWEEYRNRLSSGSEWIDATLATADRIAHSQLDNFVGIGPHMSLGPLKWQVAVGD